MSTTFPVTSFVSSAPGKIILSGEHAVVHGAHAVAAVVDLRTFAAFRFGPSSTPPVVTLVIRDSDFRGTYAWTLDVLRRTQAGTGTVGEVDAKDLVAQLDEQLSAPHAICNSPSGLPMALLPACVKVFLLLLLCFPSGPLSSAQCPGFTVVVESALPISAGMGSSASFSAALSMGMAHVATALSGKDVPIGTINDLAFQCERLIHGTPSGVDNTCAVYGGVVVFRRGHPNQFLPMPATELLVTNTKQDKSTKVLVAGVKVLKEAYPSVVDPIVSAIDHLSLALVNAIGKAAGDSSNAARAEFERAVGTLFTVNHHLLNSLGVGHRVLDAVFTHAASVGIGCTKITGAGGGGCAITLIPTGVDPSKRDRMIKLNALQGFDSFVTQIGQRGAMVHAPREFSVDDVVAGKSLKPPSFASSSLSPHTAARTSRPTWRAGWCAGILAAVAVVAAAFVVASSRQPKYRALK